MNISSTTSVQAAVSAASSDTADSVNILVLKKALDMQATSATALLQALPQPALATEGMVGTQINTFA
ncbi:putative motility protein [Rhodoferax ferrireducens]|uniref:putative motility protein n=1 Tax=Rhodoferax ferrireducens TaxID=192843 RepID=UPI000E0DBAA0|nr:YjfB family protein [Rhodoferax ferrireducens]